MGLRPCAGCSRRYVGKAQWIYVTIMVNGDEVRRKGPCCGTCFDSTIIWLRRKAQLVPGDGIAYEEAPLTAPCMACSEPSKDGCCIFATDYATKTDRRDWFGMLCESCALGAAGILEEGLPGYTQRPLPGP